MSTDKDEQVEEALESLIVSVIAVNNCSLAEAYGLREALGEKGLTKISVFKDEIPDAFSIKTILIESGYRRGHYVALLLGERIKRILETAKKRGHKEYLILLGTDKNRAANELKQLYGVGPMVIKNYLVLQFGADPDIR